MRNKWILLVALCIQMPLFAQNDTIIRHYTDTVIREVTDTVVSVISIPDSTLKQREVVIPADSSDRRGHYIQAHVGLGYGSLGYNLSSSAMPTATGRQEDPWTFGINGSFSALLQLQYAYFFHPNWGIGAGLWLTNYTSHATLGGQHTWYDQTDTDTEAHYDHTARVNKWRERETLHNVGIPISLQFQMRKDDWTTGIFAAVGIAPSFSISKKYRLQEGEIEHYGDYSTWNLQLSEMHEFGVKDYTGEPEAKGTMSVRPQVAFFADLGTLIPLTKQIDLMIGGYFNIAMNDANSSDKQELGWRDDNFGHMNAYNGLYATTNAGASHPWEVGVKVGIHWHYIAPDKHEMEDYFEYFTREETQTKYIARQDTQLIARVDTLVREPERIVTEDTIPEPIRQVAEEVERFNKIYFAFDSYQLTNKAKFYLNSIVAALNRVPEAKIMIDGHASSEGEDAYNDILSENRARTVRNYLGERGVDKSRIVTAGHGSRVPNEDLEREEMRRDRRVEVKVVYENNNQ